MISKEFKDAIVTGGSCCSILCELCGRVHYVVGTEAGDYEPGELEECETLHEKDPDKAIEWDSSVWWGYFAGKQVVIGCPCNEEKLKPYENFIWSHRYMITQYLVRRAHNIFDDTRMQDETIGELSKILDKLTGLEYKRVVKKKGEKDGKE